MNKVITWGVVPALTLASAYYVYISGVLVDETPVKALQTMSVEVPPPMKTEVSNRAVVIEDRKALAVYADSLKKLYSAGYFKKIQMARESELDAKIAGSMQKVRDAGYIVGDGGTFTLSQAITNTGTSLVDERIKVTDSKAVSDEGDNQKKNSYYDTYAVLSSMRLLMTEGNSATFDIGGEYINLSPGETLGAIHVSSIDFKQGRATIISHEHGLSRTLMISRNSYRQPTLAVANNSNDNARTSSSNSISNSSRASTEEQLQSVIDNRPPNIGDILIKSLTKSAVGGLLSE